MKSAIIILVLLFSSNYLYSQSELLIDNIDDKLVKYRNRVLNENKFEVAVSIGISLDIGWKSNGSLRGIATISFLQNLTNSDVKAMIGGQSELVFFRGGLGSSLLNSERSKINIELRNTLMILSGWEAGNKVAGKPAFVTVESENGALYDPLDYSISLGTTFINGINHRRNQQIGSMSASILNALVQYYNDGPPFDKLALSDNYDRYWTGGGMLGVYFKNSYSFLTDFVVRYDNYTGYQRNLYEIASMLNIDNLPYLIVTEQLFNQARFQYKIGIKNVIDINYSVFEPKYTDVQYLIHYLVSKSPFHPRPLGRRQTFGFDYNYLIDLK